MFKFFNIFFLLLCISCSDLERVNEYDDFHIDNAPDAPINFSITQNNSNITLTWNNNTETDLAGYNIYIGYKEYSFSTLKYTLLNSFILVTNTYSYTISEDADVYNDTYYYYIKAIDYDENQSDVSNTISVVYPIPTSATSDITPPNKPTGVTTVEYLSGSKTTWYANTESDIDGYNVYRSTSANGTYGKINSSLITYYLYDYDNAGLIDGTTYYYRVTAVDDAGNESEMSDYSSFLYTD